MRETILFLLFAAVCLLLRAVVFTLFPYCHAC